MNIKDYFSLTKPGMVLGNALVAAAAFIFASPSIIDWWQFFVMLTGFCFIVASACVFNNYFDRHIDAKMTRTQTRALAAGLLPPFRALVFGFALLLLAVIFLFFTNPLALAAALAGFVVYVCLYTPLKHHSGMALYVGAVAGAMPPLVGYAAAVNMLDTTACILFIALFLWQLPHFISIAIYRYEEYAAAGVPLHIRGPFTEKTKRVARGVFYASLVALLFFCLYLILQR